MKDQYNLTDALNLILSVCQDTCLPQVLGTDDPVESERISRDEAVVFIGEYDSPHRRVFRFTVEDVTHLETDEDYYWSKRADEAKAASTGSVPLADVLAEIGGKMFRKRDDGPEDIVKAM